MFDCPVCGERLKQGAVSCPGCGADAETGWRHGAFLDEERTEDFLEEEPPEESDGEHGPAKKEGAGCLYVALVALVAAALIAWLVAGGKR